MVGSVILFRKGTAREEMEDVPFSNIRFSPSHRHRVTSSSVTTRRTSSSSASLPSFTHVGSGHPTRPTSPSAMQSFQKSSRHPRQKTWLHDSRMQRAPLTEVRHTEHAYDIWENRVVAWLAS